MKIAVFTPIDHFHSPVFLRALRLSQPGDEIVVITTPKLKKRSYPFLEIFNIIRESGADYLLSLLGAKIFYAFLAIWEKFILRRQFVQREFISVRDVIWSLKLTHRHTGNINAPENISFLESFQPDIIITAFFNQIVRMRIISLARRGAINIHPSYLPAYRGISPCFWYLANNESMGGVSVHMLTKGIDDGPVIWQTHVRITPQDTFFMFYRRCATTLAENTPNILRALARGEKGIPQDINLASHVSVISPQAVRRFRRHHRKFAWLI